MATLAIVLMVIKIIYLTLNIIFTFKKLITKN